MLNQMLGSPLGGSIGRILLRTEAWTAEAVGPGAAVRFGAGADRFVWAGETQGLHHRVTLWLHPTQSFWAWRVELRNASEAPLSCDAILVQDLGLGERNFVTGNEAFASQYIGHHIAAHPRFGPVVMSRQHLAQFGRHPWAAHGCFEGAKSFATDALQLFGPAYRDAASIDLPFGANLPGVRCSMKRPARSCKAAREALRREKRRRGHFSARSARITAPRPAMGTWPGSKKPQSALSAFAPG